MFPSIKAKQKGQKAAGKEKNWDDRFHLNEAPGYSPLKDKHTKSYRKILMSNKSIKFSDIESPQSPLRKRKPTFSQKLQNLLKEIYSLHEGYQSEIQKYLENLRSIGAADWFIYFTFLPLTTCSDINGEILQQTKMIKEKSTFFHRIETAINVRQECIKKLKNALEKMKEEDFESVKNELKKQINHLRFLTANLIDEVKKWRDSIGKREEKPVYFNSQKQNILIQILNDTNFIFKSKLSTFVNFGTRNDPFLLAPFKKSQGKESSQFLDVMKLQRELPYYQKYMDYLAGQKAYEMRKHLEENPPKKSPKLHVQKIYNQHKSLMGLSEIEEKNLHDSDVVMIEQQKVREERIRKNQQRINEIKHVYEKAGKKRRYQSERKIVESEPEETKLLKRKKKQIRIKQENQFQNLVKRKLDTEDYSISRIKPSKSVPKMQTKSNEDKMFESLKIMEQKLKSKLKDIKETDNDEQLLKRSRSSKTNEEIMSELKKEIITKLDRQTQEKQLIKKKKRLEDERQLEEVRERMKREMQDKIERRKREKLLEREELEKKLKEEEEKLSKQRDLQLQLHSKINKEREFRQLEKLKRESLEKEYKLKMQLEKEQQLRKQKEEAAQKEKAEKEALIRKMKKNQIKQNMQVEVKNQIKQLETKIQSENKREQNQMKKQHVGKEEQMKKEIELLKLKQEREMEQVRKENQLRSRMLKLQQEEESLKQKQLEYLMRNVIQNEKQEIEDEAIEKKVQLEEEVKRNARLKMQEDYENERKNQIQIQKVKKQRELEEETYRQKVREKIQKELRVEAIHRTKRQLEERQKKNYQKLQKAEQVKEEYRKNFQIDPNRIQQDERKVAVEKAIFERQARVENAKTSLRSQFQKELFTSGVPQLYEDREAFQLKKTENYLNDDHLYGKLGEEPKNEREDFYKQEKTKEKERKEIMQMKHILSHDELHIYEKKKSAVNKQQQEKPLIKKQTEEEIGYELMKKQSIRNAEQEEYPVQVIKQQKQKKTKEKEKEVEKEKKGSDDSEDQQYKRKEKTKKKNKNKKKIQKQSESSLDSEDNREKINKKKIALVEKKKKKVFVQEQEDTEKQSVKEIKKIKKVVPSEEKKNKRDSEDQHIKNATVHYDAEQKNVQKVEYKQVQPISIKKIKLKPDESNAKFTISLEAIPEDELDRYLEGHFSRIPVLQKDVFPYDREQLYRKLVSQLAFSLLIGHYLNKQMGLALVYHDRSRSDLRKMSIVHIGTYKNEDLKEFIIYVSNYIFRKDPCDEVEFIYTYNQLQNDQLAFSNDFNKWFDKHGNIYQKKLDSNIYERKYVFKRQFNQKCQIVLNGINKNTFRNIFSVYQGVLMSNVNMVQFKDDLKDIVTPEEEISYAILLSQLFRAFLTPQQAQILKGKVKDFAKLKELLVVVVSLQKKKVKMEELKLYEFPTLIELNMKLMSQGKDVIRYIKDPGVELNEISYCELSHGFNLPFNFQTTSLPVETKEEEIRQISYFRLSPLPPYKLHIIKSSLYNGEMNLLPTENSKYKMFVMNGQQYIDMKENSKLDLFLYLRLFLKNVRHHSNAAWKYVWLPQMVDKAAWAVREFRSFLNKDIYTNDYVNFSYKQFLPGALIIEPEHRDLVITPPFIVGIMSMTLEQVTEGSPLYARLIEADALKTMQVEQL